jgi:hypothetical protein
MNFKIRPVGQRINLFENSLTNDVRTFNMIFNDYPLNLPPDELIEVGEIIKVNCYEIITSSGKIEHFFERRKLDESIIDDDFNDRDDF